MTNLLKRFINTISFGRLFGTTTDASLSLKGESDATTTSDGFSHKLNISDLDQNMARIVNEESGLIARDYDEDLGVEPLITKLIRKFREEWSAWEHSHCADLRETEDRLKVEMTKFSQTNIETTFFSSLAEYGSVLKERLKNAFRLRESNKLKGKELRHRRDDLEDGLTAMKISLTGDKNKGINAKSSKWSNLAIIFMILAIGAVENILGFGTFKFESDTLTAFALSTTVVAVFAAMAYIGGNGASKLITTWDAHRRYRTNYPTDRSIPKDRKTERPILPHRPSILAWAQFLLGTSSLVLASLVLLIGRVGIIQKMSNDDSSMYLAGAIALIFLNFILYVFEVLYGSKYDSHDIKNYAAIEKDLAEVTTELQGIKPGAHLDEINFAITDYEASIDKIKNDLTEQVQWLQGLVLSYGSLHEQYKEGWRKTRKFFNKGLTALGNALHEKQGLTLEVVKNTLDNPNRRLIEELELEVPRPLANDVFLGHVNEWKPEMPILNAGDKRISDYTEILNAAETEMVEEAKKDFTNLSEPENGFAVTNWS